jgi:hypothetical protein
MQGGRSARAHGGIALTAVAALAAASLALAAGASGLTSTLTIGVGKKPAGPFDQSGATVKVAKARSFYFRVKNTAPARLSVKLLDRSVITQRANVGNFSIRWFKGRHEVSSQVFGDGYLFHLSSDGKKVFRALVKPRNAHPGPLCLAAEADQQPTGAQAFGQLNVNSPHACPA